MSVPHYGIVKSGTNIIFLETAKSHFFIQMNIDKITESWLRRSPTVLKYLGNSGTVKHH